MSSIVQNLANLQQAIQSAALQARRDATSINILAVSKGHSTDHIRQAYQAGLTWFGESYLQEALPKMTALEDLPLTWHFIGPVQSNKTKDIAGRFHWVHSVDRLKIAVRLSEQRPAHLQPLNVCIQVNISQETAKSGIMRQALKEFAAQLRDLPRLRLRGLMAIAQKTGDTRKQRAMFAQMRHLFDDLKQHGYALDTLSMGMTADLEAAVLEGSTLLRIGSGLFGPRAGK